MRFQWTQKYCCLAVALLGLFTLPTSVLAQPANDDCAGAQVVTLGTPYSINNQTATNEPLALDPGSCNLASLASLTRGVWFRLDSTFDGALKCNETSTQDIAWGVWEMDTAGAACPTAGPATYCSASDDLQIRVYSNKTYYFLVHTDSATVSTVSLAVTFTQITPPAYDTCDGAIVVSNGSTFTSATTTCTNDLIDIGSCNLATLGSNMARGVWFRYDHPLASPNQVLRMTESSSHDISVGIWSMPTASAVCPTSGPATICTSNEIGETPVTAGNTYYFLVSTNSLVVSAVALNVSFALLTPPPNDDCANAQMVTLDTTYSVINNSAVSELFDVGTCNLASLTSMTCGVWFRYDATFSGVIRATESSTQQNIAAGIWEMDTVSASCPSSGPATLCASAETFHFNVQPNKTYYILVFTDSLTPPYMPMDIRFTQALPPSNDECSGALAIVPNTNYVVDNISAIDDPTDLPCAFTVHGVAKNGVWFKFDCTQTGTLQFSETSAQNIATGVYEVDTISATCPASMTAPTFCSSAEAFNLPVTDGKTYYFLVMNDTNAFAEVPVSLSISYVPPAPPNDDCVNATVVTSFPSRYVVDNRGALPDLDAGGCSPGASSPYGVWFRYDSVSTSGVVLVEQSSSQQLAMGVWVASDCPTTGEATICAVFGLTGPQRFGFPVSPGNTYFINLHTSSSLVPVVAMDVKFSLLPKAGDNCSDAVPIVGTGVFTFHNLEAFDPQAPFTALVCGATANAAMALDSWYKWVAPVTGKASIYNRGLPTPFPCRLAVFQESAPGVCPTSTSSIVRCANMGGGGSNSGIPDGTAAANGIDTWNVVAGQTYYFQFASQLLSPTFLYVFADMELLVQPTVNGRCCIDATSCLLTSLEDCTARGGTYGGDGSACVPATGTTSSYTGGSIAMPPNNPYSNGTITVADTFIVDDVEVVVDINNPALLDVRLALIKDGAMVTLTHRGRLNYIPFGNLALGLAGAYTFNDMGATSLFDAMNNYANPAPTGVYRPAGSANINNGLRANFHGKSAAGVWTLVAAGDGTFGNGGVVNSWTLRLKRGGASACGPSNEMCCRGTTCNPVDAGTCTGAVAGSNSLVVASCGAGNTMASCCYADYNHDGTQSIDDLFLYFNAYFTGSPWANVGGDGIAQPTIDDLFLYISAYFGTCS